MYKKITGVDPENSCKNMIFARGTYTEILKTLSEVKG